MNLATIIVLIVSCVIFFIIFALVIVYFIKNRRADQVSASNPVYQSVPRDSGLSIVIESVTPKEIFCHEVLKDPCCICFDKIEIGNYYKKLKCKHIYHSNCIEDWINEKNINSYCPLCLKPILK